jgi:hypothetical protein
LLFDFLETWKPDEASQYLEGDIVTSGRGNRQVGLHPLAVFASALEPRTKNLKAYSKEDRNKIWAGLHQNSMQHCQLLGGTLTIAQQELINQTNQDPTGPDSSYLQDLLEEGYHSDEDVADEVGEEDAAANMATEIEYESSKNKPLSVLPFHDNTKKFADPLIWWRQKKSHFPLLSCLAQKYLCIPATDAPCEQIFSTASLLLSKFRNRRDPELAGRMVFIKKNFEWYEAFLWKKVSEED